MILEARVFRMLFYVVPINNGNCRLTMRIAKGRSASDVLTHTFEIGVFSPLK